MAMQLSPTLVRGYRAWAVLDAHYLHSIFIPTAVWHVPYIRATCAASGLFAAKNVQDWHTAPEATCQCGIYVHKDLVSLYNYLEIIVAEMPYIRADIVLGTALLWGRVVEHEHGWRGEYARPDALFTPAIPFGPSTLDLQDVARLYDVPLLPLPPVPAESIYRAKLA